MSTPPAPPAGSEETAVPPSVTFPSGSEIPTAAVAMSSVDQLPEYEPLTPELVEDEAIRGDFVIRWAVVLLALLFGWTQIDDTSLLVRIRDGQQHLLPFGNDTFSASAGNRAWVNLAWLFDPILAGVYGVVGATGLTVLGALVSALTFWVLSRTSVKGVSTWWGSVCAAVALVAVFPQLIPGPTGIALLGVALVVYQLHKWSEDRSAGWNWQLPVTIWLWSQLDPRAWLGVAIVVLYALSWVGLRGTEEGDTPDKTKNLWKLAGACVLAWVIHPLHYHVLLSPLTAYQTEYPELRAYKVFDWPQAWQWFPVFSPEFQAQLDRFSIAGLGLCGLAVLTFLLNYKRLTWEWLLPWVGVVALAAFGAHQLPVAALFSCALITINAQLWYRGTFSQKYTVDSMPLAWNRGGRSLTVVSLLLLGLIVSNGMLMGRDGRRVGSGFSPQMQTSITGAEKLASEVASKEVFNFRLEQGDLLIWAGLKPFVDRRLSLYATGGENLLAKHRDLRLATLTPNPKIPKRGKPLFWKAEFEKLHINHAIPRLSGPSPDYSTLVEMLSQGWALTSLQSFGAVLSRPDSPDAAFQKYRQEHPDVDFVKQAFRTDSPKTPATDGPWIFPRRPTVYDNYLWQPQLTLNEPLQLASHEQALVQLLSGSSAQDEKSLLTTMALAMSALRHARQGIILDPQSARGYQLLAQSATFLYRIDSLLATNFRMQYPSSVWLNTALHAYQHALQLDPGNPSAHEDLAALQLPLGKRDLALNHMVQVFRLTGSYTTLPKADARHEEMSKANLAVVTELKRHVKKVTEAAMKDQADGGKWDKSLQTAMQGQCPGVALQYLEENRIEVAKSQQLQMLQAGFLADVGRTEDALRQADSLVNMLPKSGPAAAQSYAVEMRLLAAMTNLAIGDNAQLETLIGLNSRLMSDAMLRNIMDQAPFAAGPSIQLDLLPASEGVTAYHALYQSPENWANDEMMIAQSEMSTWHNEAAKTRLQAILENQPNVSVRPLVAFYLQMLTGEQQQPMSPEMQSAMEKAAAAAQKAGPEKPAEEGELEDAKPAEATPVPASPAATPDPEAPVPPVAPPVPPASPPAPPESTPLQDQKPE